MFIIFTTTIHFIGSLYMRVVKLCVNCIHVIYYYYVVIKQSSATERYNKIAYHLLCVVCNYYEQMNLSHFSRSKHCDYLGG